MATQKKKSNGLKIVLILVVFIIIFVVLNKKSKAQNGQGLILSNKPIGSAPLTSSQYSHGNTVLSNGMRNDQVRKLQYIINQYNKAVGLPQISVDGIFGPQTATALKRITGISAGSYNDVRSKIESELRKRGIDPNNYI